MDLMITDMMMPGMDGGTLARLIRVERPEIRILLISGYSEEVARGDIVDTDDFHFLPKPFSLSQLVAKVKDVLKDADGIGAVVRFSPLKVGFSRANRRRIIGLRRMPIQPER